MLLEMLRALPSSITSLDKEFRQAQTKKVQLILDQGQVEELSEEHLLKINEELIAKNYRLIQHQGKWILLDSTKNLSYSGTLFHNPEADSLLLIDELLSDVRSLRSDISEAEACRIKFNNNTKGIPVKKQKMIEGLVRKIDQGVFDNTHEETQLKLIEVLSLYSNHLDQQTTDQENPKPSLSVKEETVRHWLEMAYKLGQKLIPELDKLIIEQDINKLLTYKAHVLSSISLALNYLGRARRYNPSVSIQERLPFLTMAVMISKHLETLRKESLVVDDLHYYSSRTATFEMPVVFSLRQLGQYEQAAKIVREQLKQFYEQKNCFHMIQGHTQLCEIAREQYEHQNTGIQEAIRHAEKALWLAAESAEVSGENYRKHLIYFNAAVAAIKAYSTAGEMQKAQHMAESILAEYEQDPNCGARVCHIEVAKEILGQSLAFRV